jgi:hypothetical protein
MARVRDDLLAYVGPNPTPVERMLIERAAVLSLRLAQIDRKIFEEADFTVTDNHCTIAWQNALTRCLVALRMPAEAARGGGASFAEVLAELNATDRRAAAKGARGA